MNRVHMENIWLYFYVSKKKMTIGQKTQPNMQTIILINRQLLNDIIMSDI